MFIFVISIRCVLVEISDYYFFVTRINAYS